MSADTLPSLDAVKIGIVSISELVDAGCCLVLTTGGTGPALRDVTPEATLAVAHKEMPGFGEQMRQISLRFVPTAILSRQVAVIRGQSLIINLPGQPKAIAETLEGLKDADGHWFTIHSGTLGFMVNVDALKGKPVPRSWADLLKPEYKGLIGYLDPASAFVGYVGAVAINQARGGSMDNFGPATTMTA